MVTIDHATTRESFSLVQNILSLTSLKYILLVIEGKCDSLPLDPLTLYLASVCFFFFTNIDNYYDTPDLRTLNFKLQALLLYYIVAILAIFLTFAKRGGEII